MKFWVPLLLCAIVLVALASAKVRAKNPSKILRFDQYVLISRPKSKEGICKTMKRRVFQNHLFQPHPEEEERAKKPGKPGKPNKPGKPGKPGNNGENEGMYKWGTNEM